MTERKVLGYIVSVEVQREIMVPASTVYDVVKDIGEGAHRDRKHGWVKPPAGTIKTEIKTEQIFAQTVESLDMAKLVQVVNGLNPVGRIG